MPFHFPKRSIKSSHISNFVKESSMYKLGDFSFDCIEQILLYFFYTERHSIISMDQIIKYPDHLEF